MGLLTEVHSAASGNGLAKIGYSQGTAVARRRSRLNSLASWSKPGPIALGPDSPPLWVPLYELDRGLRACMQELRKYAGFDPVGALRMLNECELTILMPCLN